MNLSSRAYIVPLVSHKKWSIVRQPPSRPWRTIESDWVERPRILRGVSIYKRAVPRPLKGLNSLRVRSLFSVTRRLILHCQPSNRRTSIRSHDQETIESSILRSEIKKFTAKTREEKEGARERETEEGSTRRGDRTWILDAFDHPSPTVVIWCQFFAIKWKTGVSLAWRRNSKRNILGRKGWGYGIFRWNW